MREPKGYKDAQSYTDGFKLPAGGYVVKIISAEGGQYSDGNEFLEIKFDIAEGEYRGFYQKQYENQTFEPKKYKGTMKINWPNDDGSDQDERKNRQLKSNMNAIEDSNEGFRWDWDEKKLVGKIVGLLFCDAEYNVNGNRGWWTKPKWFISADRIREGKFTTPKSEPLREESQTSGKFSGFVPVDDEPPF